MTALTTGTNVGDHTYIGSAAMTLGPGSGRRAGAQSNCERHDSDDRRAGALGRRFLQRQRFPDGRDIDDNTSDQVNRSQEHPSDALIHDHYDGTTAVHHVSDGATHGRADADHDRGHHHDRDEYDRGASM